MPDIRKCIHGRVSLHDDCSCMKYDGSYDSVSEANYQLCFDCEDFEDENEDEDFEEGDFEEE